MSYIENLIDGTFPKTYYEKWIYKLCNLKEIEEEYHFLLRCTPYNDIICVHIDIENHDLFHEIQNQDN